MKLHKIKLIFESETIISIENLEVYLYSQIKGIFLDLRPTSYVEGK